LTVDVEPKLRRRIKVAAASRDETIRDFLERAILRELEKDEGGRTYDEEQEFYPAEGPKPQGLPEGEAPRARSGRSVADAVIEDRR
jgi:hypothetical protein